MVLLKPRTYVNKSGDAVVPAMKRWKVDPQHLVVVHDELDLPAGRIRIRAEGGDGGYKGLKSIIASLGSHGLHAAGRSCGDDHRDRRSRRERQPAARR